MFKEKIILISGGTGSWGRELTTQLLKSEPKEIRIFSRNEFNQVNMQRQYNDKRLKFILGDVRDFDAVLDATKDVNVLFHLAALKHVPICEEQPNEVIKTNIIGTQNIIKSAYKNKINHVIDVSSDKTCVSYHTPIELKNGKSISIGKLVNKKLNVEVATMTERGVEFHKVINWFKNKRQNRRLFAISYRYGLGNGQKCENSGSVILTEDHQILTRHNWKKVSKIKNGELIITKELCPNKEQNSFLIGCIMGDSSIYHHGHRSGMAFSHCEAQKELLNLKYNILNNFNKSIIKKYIKLDKLRNKTHIQFRFDLYASAWLSEFRNIFYPNNKKIIPKEIFKKFFSPKLLAMWFMDDGCLTGSNARIATHGFSHKEVDWLVKFLNKKNIECYKYNCKYKNKFFPELRFTVKGSNHLFKIIGKYILPTMRYKIPNWSAPYNTTIWNLGKPNIYYGKAIVKEIFDTFKPTRNKIILPPMNKGKIRCKRGHLLSKNNIHIIKQTGSRQCLVCQKFINSRLNKTNHRLFARKVYCIEVEGTHNFISHGIVLHNCAPVNLYGMTKAIGERLFINASTINKDTQFIIVRGGNALGSQGSVVPLFIDQIKKYNKVTLTHLEMTRFFITLSEAIELVLCAYNSNISGGVFVMKMLSCKIIDLAGVLIEEYGNKDTQIEEIGIRPGEKIHELLVSKNETPWTYYYNDKYFLYYPVEKLDLVKVEFEEYSSNDNLMSKEEIRGLLKQGGFLK